VKLGRVQSASPFRAVSAAVLGTAAATVFAHLFQERVSVAAIYLLAVVASAAVGGLWSGLLAALLAFVGLNFFFTVPLHTFRVEQAEDLVALVVFLVVAAIVGTLFARALEDRARATRRERETRLLSYLSTKLLSGEPIERVLTDFATALLEPFELARCEVRATLDGREVAGFAERPNVSSPGPALAIPLELGEVPFGTLTTVRTPGAPPISGDEQILLEAVARQAAVALERAQLAERVRGAQVEAESSRLRAALFSSVSHDLRTPLASIKAGVTSLLDRSVSHDADQERDLLTTVLEETDRLNRLVGNLMDLSKIRAGAMTPAREPVAVDEIVASVIARMRPHLGGIRIDLAIRPDLPDVLADPVQIDQVLTNLLENAVRHSPPGGAVQISAALFRDVVQVRVGDRGPGIAPDDRERVFEAFYRGDSEPERPGSGLGLAIARAIVVAHGGRIWIEGAPGGGAVVVFELPMKAPQETP
jgi:two-component system, OmpR family, sensor histidine kinase KdpD